MEYTFNTQRLTEREYNNILQLLYQLQCDRVDSVFLKLSLAQRYHFAQILNPLTEFDCDYIVAKIEAMYPHVRTNYTTTNNNITMFFHNLPIGDYQFNVTIPSQWLYPLSNAMVYLKQLISQVLSGQLGIHNIKQYITRLLDYIFVGGQKNKRSLKHWTESASDQYVFDKFQEEIMKYDELAFDYHINDFLSMMNDFKSLQSYNNLKHDTNLNNPKNLIRLIYRIFLTFFKQRV